MKTRILILVMVFVGLFANAQKLSRSKVQITSLKNAEVLKTDDKGNVIAGDFNEVKNEISTEVQRLEELIANKKTSMDELKSEEFTLAESNDDLSVMLMPFSDFDGELANHEDMRAAVVNSRGIKKEYRVKLHTKGQVELYKIVKSDSNVSVNKIQTINNETGDITDYLIEFYSEPKTYGEALYNEELYNYELYIFFKGDDFSITFDKEKVTSIAKELYKLSNNSVDIELLKKETKSIYSETLKNDTRISYLMGTAYTISTATLENITGYQYENNKITANRIIIPIDKQFSVGNLNLYSDNNDGLIATLYFAENKESESYYWFETNFSLLELSNRKVKFLVIEKIDRSKIVDLYFNMDQ